MIVVTPGEPAGIGPDIIILLAQSARPLPWLVVGDPDMLQARARLLGTHLQLDNDVEHPACEPGHLTVLPVPLAVPVNPGQLDVANVPGVLESLDTAIAGCLDGRFSALVTGPMQKSVVLESGRPFSGHTEYLAAAAGVDDVVMLLVGGGLRVALATIHLPLRAVPDALTQSLLERRLRILHAALQDQFGIAAPRILVSGLNPHAGESGHLGREEIDVIEPVCARLRQAGLSLTGPLPADTLFSARHLADADAVMAMYHDQGLPVLKHAAFGTAVNVTLGLPFVRTSVDHGTALDMAGTGRAETGSLAVALALGAELSRERLARA